MMVTSEVETRQLHPTDMELQIHSTETEAYGAVLRAFIAQSDVLSWSKETLISELRKELRVSDVEHREILGKVHADSSVKALRKLRKGSGLQQEQPSIPRKRLKIAHTTLSSSPRQTLIQASPVGMPLLMTHFVDDQWDYSRDMVASQANTMQGTNSIPHSKQTSGRGTGRGLINFRSSRKDSVYSGGIMSRSGPHTIHIRATEKLICEVERVCGGANPDQHQVERAKLILREHERALVEAIARLPDVLDDGDFPDPRQQPTSYEEPRNRHKFNSMAYEQVDGLGGYYNSNYRGDYSEEGIPCIDLKDEE